MPLLERITGLPIWIDDESLMQFVTYQSNNHSIVQQDTVETWAKLPNLHTLRIIEPEIPPEDLPTRINSSLLSIQELVYAGNFVYRVLNLIGSNLVHATVGTANLAGYS